MFDLYCPQKENKHFFFHRTKTKKDKTIAVDSDKSLWSLVSGQYPRKGSILMISHLV